MRRASTLAAVLAATGGLLLADAALAQSNPRYLSWPGRGAAPQPDARAPAEAVPSHSGLRRPNPVIPHGGVAASDPTPRGLTPAPGPARRTLTPATAWLRPPAPTPAPAAVVAPAPSTAAPRPAPPLQRGPEYLPDQGGRSQPAPAELVYPAPAAAADAAVDPMAPRPDALIFQMQSAPSPDAAPAPRAEVPPRPAPAPIAAATDARDAPPRQTGGRYYSVHRQNGREPDALTMPAPTFVDALVVSEIESLASQDLAAPEQGPTLIRDRNGNMRAAPAPSDGDHQ